MASETSPPFGSACAAIAAHVTARYGVAIEVAALPAPFKGDLDGSRIVVGERSDDEERLFLVAHLFGHTVQWNVSAAWRRLGMRMPVEPDADMLATLETYELEACRYSQQALHEAGVVAFDQWLADYSACDRAFIRHVAVTGERVGFRSFWRGGQPLLEPLAIPAFTPRRWRRRRQAIVF